MPERRTRLKGADAADARRQALLPTLDPGHADTFSVETTGLSPEEVARRIVTALQP